MPGKWKISPSQFRILVILCFIGTSILLIPVSIAREAKQDAWIAAIVGNIVALLLVCLYNSVGNLFPNMTIIELTEKLLGKWLGKAISLIFIFCLFINCALILYSAGDFVTTQIMPETPIQFTIIFFVIIIVMGTRLGLETFARTAEILYPLVIGLFIIFILFLLPEIEYKNINPVFEYGINPIIRGSLFYASYSSFTLIPLMIIFPAYVNNLKEAKRSFLTGTLIAGIIIFLVSILCILVLGHAITVRNIYPTYVLAKKISLGNFIERIEAIIAIIWFITLFYKSILFFYGTAIGLAQILKLKDYCPLTLPLGMILVVLSLVVYPNTIYEGVWDTTTWIPFVATYGFILPLLLLIMSYFKNKYKGPGSFHGKS